MSTPRSHGKGFAQAGSLLRSAIRQASATRGFAESRILTHWDEIAGPETARISRPVEVSYARGGMGATLVLLTTGAQAPMLEMQKAALRERVNAVYGYNAIARIRITQTAPTGFSEGRVAFSPAPEAPRREPSDKARAAAAQEVGPIHDTELKAALDRLGANILSKTTD